MTGKIKIITIEEKGIFVTLWYEGYVIEVIEREIVQQCVTKLCSNQREADTKTFLAATYNRSRGCHSVSIQTVDSDV